MVATHGMLSWKGSQLHYPMSSARAVMVEPEMAMFASWTVIPSYSPLISPYLATHWQLPMPSPSTSPSSFSITLNGPHRTHTPITTSSHHLTFTPIKSFTPIPIIHHSLPTHLTSIPHAWIHIPSRLPHSFLSHLIPPYAYHHISLSTPHQVPILFKWPPNSFPSPLHGHAWPLQPPYPFINPHTCMVLIYTHFSYLSLFSFSKLTYPSPLIPIPFLLQHVHHHPHSLSTLSPISSKLIISQYLCRSFSHTP